MRLFKWRSLKRPLVGEKRKAPRFDVSDIPELRIIAEGSGLEAKLINISRIGALIESRELLSLGDSIYLQLAMNENIHYVRGQVVDHRNSSMKDGVFKIAIAFDEEFTSLPKYSQKRPQRKTTNQKPPANTSQLTISDACEQILRNSDNNPLTLDDLHSELSKCGTICSKSALEFVLLDEFLKFSVNHISGCNVYQLSSTLLAIGGNSGRNPETNR